jgi:hypothetical protein
MGYCTGMEVQIVKSPKDYRDEAEDETYVFFDKNIRSLPKKSDGQVDKCGPGFVDNDVDAFRHAYVSGRFVHIYNDSFASLLGWLNELWSPSSLHGKNMDLWNNGIGRELARKHPTKDTLAHAVAEALRDGQLITFPGDGRVYSQAVLPKPTGDFSVVAIKKSKNGANEVYFDFNSAMVLSKEDFVSAIRAGKYAAYTLRTRNGSVYPVARSNRTGTDKLG